MLDKKLLPPTKREKYSHSLITKKRELHYRIYAKNEMKMCVHVWSIGILGKNKKIAIMQTKKFQGINDYLSMKIFKHRNVSTNIIETYQRISSNRINETYQRISSKRINETYQGISTKRINEYQRNVSTNINETYQ